MDFFNFATVNVNPGVSAPDTEITIKAGAKVFPHTYLDQRPGNIIIIGGRDPETNHRKQIPVKRNVLQNMEHFPSGNGSGYHRLTDTQLIKQPNGKLIFDVAEATPSEGYAIIIAPAGRTTVTCNGDAELIEEAPYERRNELPEGVEPYEGYRPRVHRGLVRLVRLPAKGSITITTTGADGTESHTEILYDGRSVCQKFC